MSSWKRDFGRGLIVLGPILTTLFILSVVYSFVANFTPGILLNAGTLEPFLPVGEEARRRIAGFLRVVTLLGLVALLTFVLGNLTRTTAGELIEEFVDYTANRVPGVRLVYNASKTATETTFGEGKSIQTPVKLETWKGARMTAFKTGQMSADGRVTLFLPTSPNITTGFIVETESDRITELDETVEEALTRVVSAGFGDADRAKDELEGTPITVIDELPIERDDE